MNLLSVLSILKDLNPIKFLRLEVENRDLRSRNSELEEKSAGLERSLEESRCARREASAAKVQAPGYLFIGVKDRTPWCATCYQDRGKAISLEPSEDCQGGIRRECPACGRDYWEVQPTQGPVVTFYRKSARQVAREFEARSR